MLRGQALQGGAVRRRRRDADAREDLVRVRPRRGASLAPDRDGPEGEVADHGRRAEHGLQVCGVLASVDVLRVERHHPDRDADGERLQAGSVRRRARVPEQDLPVHRQQGRRAVHPRARLRDDRPRGSHRVRPEAGVDDLRADGDRGAARADRAASPPRLPRALHRDEAHVRGDHQQHVQARRRPGGRRAVPPEARSRAREGEGGDLRPGGENRVRQGVRAAPVHRGEAQDAQVVQGGARRRREGGQGLLWSLRRQARVRRHARVLARELQGDGRRRLGGRAQAVRRLRGGREEGVQGSRGAVLRGRGRGRGGRRR
mmetsp:Transcript_104679/g.254069  ORF Transcript_104679/g.254069 Transcript_104679/m.254069 type:complete len:316 (+) Transcript_104679:381-1328(+)